MKRFYEEASVAGGDGRWTVELDGKPIRTPAGRALSLPTEAMAAALREEWQAQAETVDPRAMPLQRAANTTIDRVRDAHAAVAAEIARYGESDLLCYRAPHPQALAEREAAVWDPLLDWAAERHGARLAVGVGLTPVDQPPEAVERLARAVEEHTVWELTGLYDLVTLSGSLVIGLAVSGGRLGLGEAWDASRVDEDWQIAEWGEDAEAAARVALKRQDFRRAARLIDLSRAD